MSILEEVGRSFNTHMSREAVGCASLLIKLSRRRKEDDLKSLSIPSRSGPNGPLNLSVADVGPMAPVPAMTQNQQLQTGGIATGDTQETLIPPTLSWADGLANIEIPDNLNIDWSEYVS